MSVKKRRLLWLLNVSNIIIHTSVAMNGKRSGKQERMKTKDEDWRIGWKRWRRWGRWSSA